MTKFMETIAYKNRNPLNIRYNSGVKWQGQDGANGGFVKFKEMYLGYRAAVKILRAFHLKGIRSIGRTIARWAPASENDTKAYTHAVLSYLNGVWQMNPEKKYCSDTQIDLRNREETVNLLMAMTRVEMGANAAQLHRLKGNAEWGYDMAVTEQGFFKGVI